MSHLKRNLSTRAGLIELILSHYLGSTSRAYTCTVNMLALLKNGKVSSRTTRTVHAPSSRALRCRYTQSAYTQTVRFFLIGQFYLLQRRAETILNY